MKSKQISNDSLNVPLEVSLDVAQHFTLFPNDVVTLKHYNGYTIKFVSPGFCEFVYRGGWGFDILPLLQSEREIIITLIEPPLKKSM